MDLLIENTVQNMHLKNVFLIKLSISTQINRKRAAGCSANNTADCVATIHVQTLDNLRIHIVLICKLIQKSLLSPWISIVA